VFTRSGRRREAYPRKNATLALVAGGVDEKTFNNGLNRLKKCSIQRYLIANAPLAAERPQ